MGYIEESLVYERAYSRVCRILNEVLEDKVRDADMSKETGEPVDTSYKILADALGDIRDRFRNESDRLWVLADKAAEKYERGYEDLYNAIVLRAAQDYEAKLCGYEDEANSKLLKMNPPECMLSQKLMRRIRDGHKKFEKVVSERGKEITEETLAARKEKRDLDENSVRCPLCGGALYAYGKAHGGSQQIKCTGCSLFGWARLVDENAS